MTVWPRAARFCYVVCTGENLALWPNTNRICRGLHRSNVICSLVHHKMIWRGSRRENIAGKSHERGYQFKHIFFKNRQINLITCHKNHCWCSGNTFLGSTGMENLTNARENSRDKYISSIIFYDCLSYSIVEAEEKLLGKRTVD